MQIIGILAIIASLLYIGFIVKLIFNIIMTYDNCNPIKTVGWIFAVFFFPVIGVIVYIVVGRNLRKKSSLFERLRNDIRQRKHKPSFGFKIEEQARTAKDHKELKLLLSHLSQLPIFPGNKIDFFTDGQDKFDSLLADIEGARNHIHVLYYTLGAGEIGTRLKDMLIKKHREGVEVRILYDAVGSNETPEKFLKEYKEAGIAIDAFSPISPPRILHRINYRNHKKIVVIDGKIGYTGGMNVKDEYVKGLSWGKWRDVHVRIEGPGAQGLQSVFFTDWYYVYKEYLGCERYFPVVEQYGDNPLQIATSEPLGEHRNIMEGMIQAIMRAKKSIYIVTPYFVPTDSILTAIQATAMSGIEIHFVMPDRSDNPKVGYASNSYVQQLLVSHVKVYRYTDGFIHSKLMVIDDKITIVGSSNMDIRSFDLNFETSLFIYNEETAYKAKQIILEDISNSRPMNLEEWNKRSTFQEFKEAFFRLFSPFL